MVTTFNGAVTNASTGSGLVDLFAVIGASRGKDLIREFKTALYLNEDVAIRTLLWARDVRGGAGERQTFRNLFVWLCENKPEIATKILPMIPEIGRWDDVLVAMDTPIKKDVVSLLRKALIESFNTQPPEGGWPCAGSLIIALAVVSTHSRPKAAGQQQEAGQ